MAVREILLLGNPKLYELSQPVEKREVAKLGPVVYDLRETLMAFREKHGIGRAIAAPQIGVMKRLFYMCVDEPVIFINPRLANESQEMTAVWDDCMCFPDLLVRVLRHKTCRVYFRNMGWEETHLDLEGDLSELIQHEYDHLDGILAVSRAIDGGSFASRVICRHDKPWKKLLMFALEGGRENKHSCCGFALPHMSRTMNGPLFGRSSQRVCLSPNESFTTIRA